MFSVFHRKWQTCSFINRTWQGPAWSPAQTLSSLLISIQSLMNEKPYHNEPGYEKKVGKTDPNIVGIYECFWLAAHCVPIGKKISTSTFQLQNYYSKILTILASCIKVHVLWIIEFESTVVKFKSVCNSLLGQQIPM